MVTVKDIRVDKVIVPEVRVNAIYDEELEEQLASSLKVAGQLVPILVIETPEGYELVDGRNRLEDAQRSGRKTIEAKVMPGDSVDALLFNLATNRLRGKTRASEMVLVIDELVHNRGMDSDQIQARTGLTRDYIERLWRISEAHALVREALDKELIGVGVAFQVSRLPRAEQQEMVMSTVHTFHMRVDQVKALVDDTLKQMEIPAHEEEPAPAPEPEPPRCEVCLDVTPPNLLVSVALDPKCFGKISVLYQQDRDLLNRPEKTIQEGASP